MDRSETESLTFGGPFAITFAQKRGIRSHFLVGFCTEPQLPIYESEI
jgi:hypothetical protein